MRTVGRLGVLLGLALALVVGVSAQTFESVPQAKPTATAAPATGAAVKIGIINVQVAMVRTQEGRKASEELQARFSPRQAELQKLQDEIRGLDDQLRTQERTLSDEARGQILRDIETKRKQGTRLQQDLQEDYEDAQSNIINQLGEKMQRVIDRYARENSLNLIFNVAPGGPIIFATPTVDITDDIIKLFDQTYPVQAAQQKPVPAPKPNQPRQP
ncbi:MAG: OmpH family outer membrane protein [Candidatus Acidiferrales bacterium]